MRRRPGMCGRMVDCLGKRRRRVELSLVVLLLLRSRPIWELRCPDPGPTSQQGWLFVAARKLVWSSVGTPVPPASIPLTHCCARGSWAGRSGSLLAPTRALPHIRPCRRRRHSAQCGWFRTSPVGRRSVDHRPARSSEGLSARQRAFFSIHITKLQAKKHAVTLSTPPLRKGTRNRW
jgi:hypothetical protein